MSEINNNDDDGDARCSVECAFRDAMESAGTLVGTDKIHHHQYHRWFAQAMHGLCSIGSSSSSTAALLEIGVNQGASMRMWDLLLPRHFTIVGVDRDASSQVVDALMTSAAAARQSNSAATETATETTTVAADLAATETTTRAATETTTNQRFRLLQADQSSLADLDRIAEQCRAAAYRIHCINDDGSHIPEHQLLTFNRLFPLLQPGGVYLIEDIEVSYWRDGHLYGYPARYGRGHSSSIVEAFKRVVDAGLNAEFSSSSSSNTAESAAEEKDNNDSELELLMQHGRRDMESVTFGRNCIVIRKKTELDRDADAHRRQHTRYMFENYL